jgi:hypothetical protein
MTSTARTTPCYQGWPRLVRVVEPSGNIDGTYTYKFFDKGDQVTFGYLYFTQCTHDDTNYWWASFAVPYIEGSRTLVVYQSDPEGTVGSDSFLGVD